MAYCSKFPSGVLEKHLRFNVQSSPFDLPPFPSFFSEATGVFLVLFPVKAFIFLEIPAADKISCHDVSVCIMWPRGRVNGSGSAYSGGHVHAFFSGTKSPEENDHFEKNRAETNRFSSDCTLSNALLFVCSACGRKAQSKHVNPHVLCDFWCFSLLHYFALMLPLCSEYKIVTAE